MRKITWDNKSFYFDGKPGFLVSGEFHYFRVPKKDWAWRLDMLKAAGANAAATYVPWILHEPEEGVFRFSDAPETDLDGFLTLCREKGLPVIVRPGPYQYSEMRYCGLPGWLFEKYPEILAKREDGSPIAAHMSVSYLHPVFLEKTRAWFDAVLPVIARHMVSKGGAVAFAQLDNELTGIHEWAGSFDYSPEAMGYGRETGRWAEFVQKRPNAPYRDFYFGTVAEYCGILAGWMRERGIACDLIHNGGNPGMIPYFRETAERLGKGFLLGVDTYYNLGMDFEQINPVPRLAADAFLAYEQLRLMGYPPAAFEMQAGSPCDWPPITPEDVSCWYRTHLAYGMKGVNYYVFTGGRNPAHIGGDGDLYDYNAPIGPENEIRPLYGALSGFGAFLAENSWLAAAWHESDYYLALDWEQPREKPDLLPEREKELLKETDFGFSRAWKLLKKGVLFTSFCASYTPEAVDLSADFAGRTDRPFVVCASRRMPERVQRGLVKLVENGGKLLILPVIPELGENGEPCAVLRDFLGGGCEKAAGRTEFCYAGELCNLQSEGVWLGGENGGKVLARDAVSGRTAAWKKEFPGGGAAVWLGMDWKLTKRAHLAMFRHLMAELGLNGPRVRCGNPYVWCVIRTDGDRRLLFAINMFAARIKADIEVAAGDGGSRRRFETELGPMEVRTFAVD